MRNAPLKRRRLLIRLSLVVVWIGLGILLFVLNRGHTLIVDNHNVDSLRAPDLISVSVNNGKALEYFRGDRDLFKVRGSKQQISIEFSDGKPVFKTTFTLPIGPDMFLLSIPKMINGIEPYIEVFYTQPEKRNDDEEVSQPEDL